MHYERVVLGIQSFTELSSDQLVSVDESATVESGETELHALVIELYTV